MMLPDLALIFLALVDIRASSSTLRQKNRKIGNISLENRNKIGIYEIKEEQNRNIGSLKQLILLIWI